MRNRNLKHVTTQEAADALGMTPSGVTYAWRTGKLRGHKIGTNGPTSPLVIEVASILEFAKSTPRRKKKANGEILSRISQSKVSPSKPSKPSLKDLLPKHYDIVQELAQRTNSSYNEVMDLIVEEGVRSIVGGSQ